MATAVIIDKQKQKLKSIKPIDYPIAKILYRPRKVAIKEILPFRVKLTNITVPGYSSSNIPGIGIQVIGFSNYIL
jgi:hypothetical protein